VKGSLIPRMEVDGLIADFELESRKLVLFCRRCLAGQMRDKIVSLNVETGASIVSETRKWLELKDLKVGQHIFIRYRLDQGNNFANEIVVFETPVKN